MTATSSISTRIVGDPAVPEGVMNGFRDGRLIVSLRYIPDVQWLIGTEADQDSVQIWHASPGSMRRIAAVAAWNSARNPRWPTVGNA